MRPGTLLHLYWRRARSHPVSELLALIGIATGVALIFAVQVANTSIAGSAGQVVHGVTGSATLELTSRSSEGFPSRTFEHVRRLPGVRRAAPLLEVRATVRGPGGRRSVTLAGADYRLARMGGSLLRQFDAPGLASVRGVALPTRIAHDIGADAGDRLELQIGGTSRRTRILTLLEEPQVGALAEGSIAPAPLREVQHLSGLEGRLTRVLVAVDPHREAAVRSGLRRIAGGRLNVGDSDTDIRLLEQAGGPGDQSTALFAAISALIGVFFAINATLLTAHERRRFLDELRMDGYDDRGVLQMVVFEGLVLGCAASLVGLAFGDQLSRHWSDPTPGYLSSAFALGDHRVVTASTVLLALASGITAALIATARPLGDIVSRRPPNMLDLEPAARRGGARRSWPSVAGATALLAASTCIFLLSRTAAVPAVILLIGAMLLSVGPVLRGVLRLAEMVGRGRRFPMLLVSIGELRSTTTRSVALAATGALAVFASVAIGGANRDLLRGLYDSAESFVSTADVWVTAGGDDNSHTTAEFRPRPEQVAALRHDAAVARVRVYRGATLDMAGRRIWVVARPVGERTFVARSQLVRGDVELSSRRLRAGGWVTLAAALADRLDVQIGERLRLPTPSGDATFRVAAITTNFGWAPGVIVMNADDFGARWQTTAATALEVDLRSGVPSAAGRRAVERTLGAGSALIVETRGERAQRFKRLANQGLARLGQISALVLIAAVLAMGAAMGGVLWQRRPRLAALKLSGFEDRDVWRALLLESLIVLGVGCVIGALFGLYAQAQLTSTLRTVTGFPVQYQTAVPLAGAVLCGCALVTTAVAGLPGYLAARVPLRFGFQDE